MLIASMVAALSPAVHAHEPVTPRGVPSGPLAGIVREEDVALAFAYAREAVGAAIRGETPPSPPQPLIERGHAIHDELERRGEAAGRGLLEAIERAIRESPATPERLPPYTPLLRTRI